MLIGPVLLFLDILAFAIIARALLSWFQPNPDNPLVRLLRAFTEPVLKPVQALIPPNALGGIDISPIIAYFAIQFLKRFLIGL